MTYKVKKVLGTKSIPKKDGSGNFTKTNVLTENDEVFELFGDAKEGDVLEGVIEDDPKYGKQFKKAGSGGGKGGFTKTPADPDTMLISYAKDIVTAFITAGVIKGEENAAKQMRNFATLMFGIYKTHKDGKSIVIKTEPPKVADSGEDREVAEVESTQTITANDEINVDDIPF